MEQSLADLLSDAFSETSILSLEDGDLDFENLNFDEKFEENNTDISHENLSTKEDRALHQETTDEPAVLSSTENKDINTPEKVDEEQSDNKIDEEGFQGAGISLVSMDQTPEDDYTSSDEDTEEESSDSGEGNEEEDMGTGEKPEDLLMSEYCSDEFCYDNNGDKIFAEGQPLTPEGTENPQVRNEEQGDNDDEVSYIGRIPECGDETTIKGDETEEDKQEREEETPEDSSDSEGMKNVLEENDLARSSEQGVESPYREVPLEAGLECSEILEQNLQDLNEDVDGEEYVEKMEDFSGEEHQEAGESFADYPSDLSSCEYVEHAAQIQQNDYKTETLPCQEKPVTDISWMGRKEETDEDEDEYLYSRDLEMDADMFMRLDTASEANGKTEIEIIGHGCDDEEGASESDSYSSSDEEIGYSDNTCLENNKKLDSTQLHSESGAAFPIGSISDDHHLTNNMVTVGDFNINWDFDLLKTNTLFEDLLTTVDTVDKVHIDKVEAPPSDVSQCPAEGINSYSAVQREDSKATSPSYQGSLDDGFFFSTERDASGMSERGQLEDDEYEEERNWEQEQERIRAFFKFYDDSDEENGREERQKKVQFCTDQLSRVIHYETDSSDSERDSLSSSTDGEEDLSSAETSEEPREPDNTLQMKPACDPPDPPTVTPTELPESAPENNLHNTQACTRKHKGLNMLKLILKMGLVILMGLVMFWLATDQADWLSQVSFF